jgi:hypothetical protein
MHEDFCICILPFAATDATTADLLLLLSVKLLRPIICNVTPILLKLLIVYRLDSVA